MILGFVDMTQIALHTIIYFDLLFFSFVLGKNEKNFPLSERKKMATAPAAATDESPSKDGPPKADSTKTDFTKIDSEKEEFDINQYKIGEGRPICVSNFNAFEYIYLVRLREHLANDEKVYKIGRTSRDTST